MPAAATKITRPNRHLLTAADHFTCNPSLDIKLLAKTFRNTGRVRIPAFLGSGAMQLADFLKTSDEWIQVINKPGGVLELDLEEWKTLHPRRKSRIQRDMYARGARGFQYSYAAIRILGEDELDEDDTPLADFSRFMMGENLLNTVEAIVGTDNLCFTDGQATAYGDGDFLTGHDDDVPGRDRMAAFVLGMTPVWRLEWGGLLIFHPTQSEEAVALIPAFNTLDLFAVPILHSVSHVMPCAEGARRALTGWLSRRSQT